MTQSLFIRGNKRSSYLMNTVSYEVWYGRYVLGGNSNLVHTLCFLQHGRRTNLRSHSDTSISW
jgi:hypothetical protein